ncbi:unnamed protein product [Colias eurytheme]|nr:unnamed protein product [Colias eurytheme]
MEHAFVSSDGEPDRHTKLLLTLNIFGVITCCFLVVFMSLWALNIIFPEPNTAYLMRNYLENLSKPYKNETIRIKSRYDVFSNLL